MTVTTSTIIADRVRDRTLTRDDFKDMASGDDINTPVDGNTPLGYAVLNGDTYAIRLLLNHKANVKKKSPNGLSVLHMAIDAKENAARVVKILLDHPDIDVDEEDDSYPHDTPLMRALNPRDAVLFSANQIGTAPQAEKFLSGLMEVSKRPEFAGVLRVSAERLDAKFSELRDNRTTLQFWINDLLFGP